MDTMVKTEPITDTRTLRSALLAALVVCSEDETRPALNSVLFEVKRHAIELVATDGHRIVIVKAPMPSSDLGTKRSFLIGRFGIERLVTVLDSRGEANDVMISDAGDTKVRFEFDDLSFKAKKLDVTFPPYESVIPEKSDTIVQHGPIALGAVYLGDLAKISRILCGMGLGKRHGVRMQTNADELGSVRFDIDTVEGLSAVYVLMPMRI